MLIEPSNFALRIRHVICTRKDAGFQDTTLTAEKTHGHIRQNIFLVDSTHLGMAALTVIMGSLTTWLIRSFMATLHSRYAWMGVKDQRAIRRSIMRPVALRAAWSASASDSTTIQASAGASGERDSADSSKGPESG